MMKSIHCFSLAAAVVSGPCFADAAPSTASFVESIVSQATPSDAEALENGCAPGTFDWQVSSDNQFLILKFRDYNIRAGLQTPGRNQFAEKSCHLTANVRVAAGWTVGIQSVTVSANGYQSGNNSHAYIENTYAPEFARRPVTVIEGQFNGPFSGDFDLPGDLRSGDILYTPCSPFNTEQRINLNSYMSVDTTGFEESSLTSHTVDRAVAHRYRFVWSQCNQPNPPPPPPPAWTGYCRIVLETAFGRDIQDFLTTADGVSEADAINNAREKGLDRCEVTRAGDSFYRCVTDNSQCYAERN